MHRVTCVFLLMVVLVQGADHAWMLFPDEHGGSHIAFLRGVAPSPLEVPLTLKEDVAFWFFTKDLPLDPVQIYVDDINNAPFDPTKTTKIIVHGYASDSSALWSMQVKDELLIYDDCQVILVDWSRLASAPLYNQATFHAFFVGEYLGKLVSYLAQSHQASLADVHVVGFSLGAHVAGFAGNKVFKMRGEKLGRITALDPALPLYGDATLDGRLDEADATFVDAIHTCSGWLGFEEAIGHADFYPNYGTTSQPGCGVDYSGCCSHARAHEYFIESISSDQFIAVECSSLSDYENLRCDTNSRAIMGNKLDNTARGIYYLVTDATAPYALG